MVGNVLVADCAAQNFTVQHECVDAGWATVSVSMMLVGYQDIKFVFRVQCGGILMIVYEHCC